MTILAASPPAPDRGFTLIELLVAMIGAGLLLAGLAAVNGQLGARVIRGAAPGIETRLGDAQAALGAALTRVLPTARDGRIVHDATFLRVPARLPDALRMGEEGILTLRVTVRGEGMALVADFADATGQTNRTVEALLTSGWRSITLASDVAADPNGIARVTLVNVRLVDAAGTAHDIAAAPRITARGGCRFDPISLQCRP